MRRELGEGRWDKILIKRMTELSVADNYDEAKEEWIATGDVWWNGNGDIPEWVSSSSHPNQCLCGHPIVYHFRIRNTENGVEEIVGSDHINSYLIMRQIAEEKGLVVGEVTDEQVAEWIKVRVGSMKAEAWWAENGDSFKLMFDKIKELDCWYNVYKKDWLYQPDLGRSEPRRVLRKKGSGQFGTRSYRMASIVWRWNHPDNPKNQFTVHGYPNDKLMQDLAYLYVTSEPLLRKFAEWKAEREAARQKVTEQREKIARERREREERRRIEEEERIRIYNLPENVEARRQAQLRREEEFRQRERDRQAREEQRRIEKKEANQRYCNLPITDAYINNCQFLGLPVLTSRICYDDEDWGHLGNFRMQANEVVGNYANTFYRLQPLLGKPPTQEQIRILSSYNLTAKDRLEAEILIQQEEEINAEEGI